MERDCIIVTFHLLLQSTQLYISAIFICCYILNVFFRNLLFLKDYQGDVTDLELDFTVMNNDFGEVQCVELKTGGTDIAVDNNNRIEYIHRMAHYRLNRQVSIRLINTIMGQHILGYHC